MVPDSLSRLPERPEVVIEAPRFTLIKRRSDGSVDFISPLPCPYNYGSIPGLRSGDGDPLDAVVLGSRLARGTRVRLPVVGVLDFVDGGLADPKVICSAKPLSASERAGLERFFRVYSVAKRALARLRGQSRDTRLVGWIVVDTPGG